MVATQSTMIQLGSAAPAFTLPNTDGQEDSLADFNGKRGVAIFFICNHCPYVKHIAPALAQISQEYMQKGIAFVAINSNDIAAYPDDDLEHMKAEKQARGYLFPYLLDESQEVAKAYAAACTPDLYLFDADFKLVYRGQFDDSRPHRISSGNYDSTKTPATGADLRVAMDQLIAGNAIPTSQIPSLGCNIKWKPGNEPDYFG